MSGWYRAAGLYEYRARRLTVRKPSDVSHKCRCIKAIAASTKVGDYLSYQAALLSKMRKVQIRVLCALDGDEAVERVCQEDGFEQVSRALLEDLIGSEKVRKQYLTAVTALEGMRQTPRRQGHG